LFGSYLTFTTTAVFTYLLILLLHIVLETGAALREANSS
ncbi:unnamed protein product, partial [Brassica napus]